MRPGANTMLVQGAAGADGADMGARMHAPVADTGAGSHDMAGMAAGRNAMAIDARTCADAANMRAGAHAMLADMRAHPHAQYLDIRAHGIGGDGHQARSGGKAGGEHFHGAFRGLIAMITRGCR
jgi:hypothetical protein